MASVVSHGKPRPGPDVPCGFWFAASVILMEAFCAGFFMPSRCELVTVDEMKLKPGEREDRQTALFLCR